MSSRTSDLPNTARLAKERYNEMKAWKKSQETTEELEADVEDEIQQNIDTETQISTMIFSSTQSAETDPFYERFSSVHTEAFRQQYMLDLNTSTDSESQQTDSFEATVEDIQRAVEEIQEETISPITETTREEITEWNYQIYDIKPNESDFSEGDRIFINWSDGTIGNTNLQIRNNSSIYQMLNGRWAYMSQETLRRRAYLEGQENDI